MRKVIALAVTLGALALAAPAAAQNCNVGGCNIVVTGKGTGTVASGTSPVIYYPWTNRDTTIHSAYTGEDWTRFGGAPGQLDMYAAPFGGAVAVHCYAVTPGATTYVLFNVRAVAGRKYSCNVRVN